MRRRTSVLIGSVLLVVSNAFGTPSANAEPLTALTASELAYLDHARRVFAVSHDPVAFRSDGRLLSDGRYACVSRAAGFVGTESTATSSVLNQLAFVYLCPE